MLARCSTPPAAAFHPPTEAAPFSPLNKLINEKPLACKSRSQRDVSAAGYTAAAVPAVSHQEIARDADGAVRTEVRVFVFEVLHDPLGQLVFLVLLQRLRVWVHASVKFHVH